jgi:hypothetical protein
LHSNSTFVPQQLDFYDDDDEDAAAAAAERGTAPLLIPGVAGAGGGGGGFFPRSRLFFSGLSSRPPIRRSGSLTEDEVTIVRWGCTS